MREGYKKIKILICALSILCVCEICSYSQGYLEMQENMKPSYIRATEARSNQIVKNVISAKNDIENKGRLKNNEIDKRENMKLDLKKKVSESTNPNKIGQGIDENDPSLHYDININEGEAIYDGEGVIIGARINGALHYFAGFEEYGSRTIDDIMQLLDSSRENNEDVFIIVAEGECSLNVSNRNNIRFYGGYYVSSQNYLTRDTTNHESTISARAGIDDSNSIEINGFNFNTSPDIAHVNGFKFVNNRLSLASLYYIKLDFVENGLIQNNIFDADSRVNELQSFIGIIAVESEISIINNDIYTEIGGMYLTETEAIIYGNNIRDTGWFLASAGSNIFMGENEYEIRYGNPYYMGEQDIRAYARPKKDDNILNNNSRDNTRSILGRSNKERLNDPADNAIGLKEGYMASRKIMELFKGLLLAKNKITFDDTRKDADTIVNTDTNVDISALSIPLSGLSIDDAKIASLLSDILKNPTNNEKEILDFAEKFLGQEDAVNEKNESDISDNAEDKIIAALTGIMIAGRIEGEQNINFSRIKRLFGNFTKEKNSMLALYEQTVSVYYDMVSKEISQNLGGAELSEILLNKLSKEDDARLKRSEIDKYVKELRNKTEKTEAELKLIASIDEMETQYMAPAKELFKTQINSCMERFYSNLTNFMNDIQQKKR